MANRDQQPTKLSAAHRGRRSGIALPMMAMLSVVFLAFLGLVFDTGLLMWKKRTMQAAADAAAWDGAHENLRGNTTRIVGAGRYSARRNGYTHSTENIIVEINSPPLSGPNQNNDHVEAIVRQPSALFFMPILGITQSTVAARAVAGTDNSGEFCVLALDDVNDALVISGSASVTANCGFRSSSCVTAPEYGFRVQGSASLTLSDDNRAKQQPTSAACGDVLVKGAANTDPPLEPEAAPEDDPFAGRTRPTPSFEDKYVTFTDHPVINAGADLKPGYYRSTTGNPAIQITGGVVNFADGLYIVEGMHINGATVVAEDVTFFNTGEGRTFDINGNGNVTMIARSENDDPVENENILFWCDETMPFALHRFNGTAEDTFTGVTYCPGHKVDWRGNYDKNRADTWGVIIAGQIEFGGNTTININEPPANVIPELDMETIIMKE